MLQINTFVPFLSKIPLIEIDPKTNWLFPHEFCLDSRAKVIDGAQRDRFELLMHFRTSQGEPVVCPSTPAHELRQTVFIEKVYHHVVIREKYI